MLRGFWVSPNPWPLWCPNADFQWVPNGMAVKYLGFLVGVEIQKNQRLGQVKDWLWASVKLLLAGRVVMVNHLLVTMWHSVACWMLDKACIKNIKAMVRGFLWSGRDHETTSGKVAWSCLIKAKNQGGLGLVDPILGNRVELRCPRNGGPWKAKKWWLFHTSLNLREPTSMEDRVARTIMRAWSSLREGLVLLQPKRMEEQL